MQDYLEFAGDEQTLKFTVAQFNKLYLHLHGNKKGARKYLLELVEGDIRLNREKNTVRGARLLSLYEFSLKQRVVVLEQQINELKEVIKQLGTQDIAGAMEEEELNVMRMEDVNVAEMDVDIVEMGMDIVGMDTEVFEIIQDIILGVETEAMEEMELNAMRMEDVNVVEIDMEMDAVIELEEKAGVELSGFELIQHMLENYGSEEGNTDFMVKMWNTLYESVKYHTVEEGMKYYTEIKRADLNNHGINYDNLSDGLKEIIKEEGLVIVNGCRMENDKEKLKKLTEMYNISKELGLMGAEDRMSTRINNILKDEEYSNRTRTNKTDRKKELKKMEEEEDKKWSKFAEKYLIADKVEIVDFNSAPIVKRIIAGGEEVEVTVKYGDNNTYSYDGKKYRKIGYLFLEMDDEGKTGKAEYYLKRDFQKITLETYQADISLDVTVDWATAQDKKNYISYEIINWLDYYTYEEMYEFTKCDFWLNKKKWDLEEMEGK